LDNQNHQKLLRLYKFGILMFALQVVYFFFVIYHSYLFQNQTLGVAASNSSFLLKWDIVYISLAYILISIILIFLTYCKLYVPEKEGRATNRRKIWVASLGILGVFFGLIIGGLVFAFAYSRIEKQT